MTANEPDRLPTQWIDLDGTRVHYVEAPGPADGPTFVMVHGLGGSLLDWDSLVPLLAQRGHVYAVDLGGHGLTEVEPERATVQGNRALLDRFLRTVVGRPAVLVGNSMGGLVSSLQAGAAPGTVSGLVLVDPVLPMSPKAPSHPLVAVAFGIYAVPPLGRWFLNDRSSKIPPEQLAHEVFKLVTAHVEKVPAWLIDRHVELSRQRQSSLTSNDAFLVAARSILMTAGVRRQTYERDLARILHPVLLVHGDRDRLVNVAAARRLAQWRSTWTYAEGADMGHCPMFEEPEWVAEQVDEWLALHPEIARKSAWKAAS
ncbi:alpha/beta fold hydrolase [Luteipulveratus mongoliensis]|uniref:AB hydrolase-1 domain-containing protein n=1 Tax=Luteipulveratus mongoliensis TaxID=571913 RepID=A0A0K1JFF5_9MICO|nr:alpha/beta hydrolase [Luteipulveratus mongoliensis]AKU15325.1 hypothetical protein VV02_04705 [Luteipulveratus mongoliensis]